MCNGSFYLFFNQHSKCMAWSIISENLMSSVITGPGIKCLDDPNFSFDEPAAAPTAAPAASAAAAVPAVAAAPSNTANPSDRPSGIPQPKKPSYRNSRFSYCEASVSATCLDGSSLCFEVVFRVEKLSGCTEHVLRGLWGKYVLKNHFLYS